MLQDSRTETEQAVRGTCFICKWLENLEYLNIIITGVMAAHWAMRSVFHSHGSPVLVTYSLPGILQP